MTAKPICIIYADVSRDIIPLYELQSMMDERMPDYHVFCLPKRSEQTESFKFEVFYEKDFTEIQYKELRELIESAIKETNK